METKRQLHRALSHAYQHIASVERHLSEADSDLKLTLNIIRQLDNNEKTRRRKDDE